MNKKFKQLEQILKFKLDRIIIKIFANLNVMELLSRDLSFKGSVGLIVQIRCHLIIYIHNYLSISKSDIRKFGYKSTISKHQQLLPVLKVSGYK